MSNLISNEDIEEIINKDFDGKCPICGEKMNLIYESNNAKFYKCSKIHKVVDKLGNPHEVSPIYMVKESE